MPNSAGAVQNGLVLRLSIPASGEMAGVGPELATRLAQQLGVTAADARKVGSALTELSKTVDPSGTNDVEFEFHKLAAELRVVATHATHTAETRVPLSV